MSLMDLLQETRQYYQKHSLPAALKLLGQNAMRGSAVRMFMIPGAFGNFETVLDEDWDLFIVLDACRYDLMAEIADDYDFLETLRPQWSYAASSQDWIQKTFMYSDIPLGKRLNITRKLLRDPYQNHLIADYCDMRDVSDTAYITANPQCSMLDREQFLRFEEVWQSRWQSEENGYVHPRAVTEKTVETMREDDPGKTVAHYMQPHGSFRLSEGAVHPWTRLQVGEIDLETTWEQYQDNLEWVLEDVQILLNNVDADKVIISADHGNSIGEYGFYGHRPYLPLKGMRQVPWVETSATDRETYEPETDADSEPESEVTRDEMLTALGYR